jgi:hypothetical protein
MSRADGAPTPRRLERRSRLRPARTRVRHGGVAEWSKAPVLKTGGLYGAPWVRIPPPPLRPEIRGRASISELPRRAIGPAVRSGATASPRGRRSSPLRGSGTKLRLLTNPTPTACFGAQTVVSSFDGGGCLRVHSSSSTAGCACESRIGRRGQAPSTIFGTQASVADQIHSIRRGGYWPRDRAIRCPRGNRHEVLRAEGLRRQRRSRPRRNGRPRSRRPIVAIPLGKGDEELPA